MSSTKVPLLQLAIRYHSLLYHLARNRRDYCSNNRVKRRQLAQRHDVVCDRPLGTDICHQTLHSDSQLMHHLRFGCHDSVIDNCLVQLPHSISRLQQLTCGPFRFLGEKVGLDLLGSRHVVLAIQRHV